MHFGNIIKLNSGILNDGYAYDVQSISNLFEQNAWAWEREV